MKLYGLIGYPLTHSFSKKYFAEKFRKEGIPNAKYENFAIETIEMLPTLIERNNDLVGLNVTIPYKEKVLHYLDGLDEMSQEVGAVNTVKIIRSKANIRLEGYNTDVIGFRDTLKPMLEKHHKKALILGTGGASKAIKYVFDTLGIEYISASIETLKEKEITYDDISEDIMREHHVIVNATPLGTYPKVETCPKVPYQYITDKHVLYDLVYNPEVTRFLQYGKEKRAKIKNGLQMLHLQAEASWKIFNQ